MTRDAFVAALAVRAPRLHWGLLGPEGGLRGWKPTDPTLHRYCPLTALTNAPDPVLWAEAAEELDLAEEDAEAIMRAADRHRNHNPTLRARLLAACGVEESTYGQ